MSATVEPEQIQHPVDLQILRTLWAFENREVAGVRFARRAIDFRRSGATQRSREEQDCEQKIFHSE
jgi:hypothetical protein